MIHARAFGVVGAGYGDEGKGLLTDWLARAHPGAVVVRTNGGAQAGHTVVAPGGVRHVFHHLGSGALAGSPSHLSRFFASNPMLYAQEAAEVAAMGGSVAVTADPRGPVTTPFDVMVNQIAERARGGARHGSCGLGFGEAVARTESGFGLAVGDLRKGAAHVGRALDRIRSSWVGARLSALGVASVTEEERDLLASRAIRDRFVADCLAYAEAVPVRADASLGAGDVIFEGAQGLMLDQDLGAFPHVTRSHTGALNMAAVAAEAGFPRVAVTYATRAYATRHGAGPLAHEVAALDFAEVADPTNLPNPWQGALRFAPLDLDLLEGAVSADRRRSAAGGVAVEASLAVTCLDQLRGHAVLMEGGRRRRVPAREVARTIAGAVGVPLAAEAWGPSGADVSVPLAEVA